MTPKEINAAITSCKDRIKDLQNKPKFYMGKGKRERAIELENIKREALEKQVPKKANIWGDGYSDGELVYDMYDCPNCGKIYELDYQEYLHCPSCGQAIDWSEVE